MAAQALFDPSQMKCSHCHNSVHFSQISRRQKICEQCRKNMALSICKHCHVHYHSDEAETDPVCTDCTNKLQIHGPPRPCMTCELSKCFAPGENECKHCHSARQKYGAPIPCAKCGYRRAFTKPNSAAHAKEDRLCLPCASLEHASKHKGQLA